MTICRYKKKMCASLRLLVATALLASVDSLVPSHRMTRNGIPKRLVQPGIVGASTLCGGARNVNPAKLSRSSLAAVNPSDFLDSLPSLDLAGAASPDSAALKEAAEAALSSLGRDIFTFLAATVAVVPLSRYFGVTPVLGFLAAGCLLGPHGLQMFANSEADVELGDFGILFLLFNEGLNLSPEKIKELATFYGLGALQLLNTMALFFFGIVVIGPFLIQYIAPFTPIDGEILREIIDSPTQAFCIASAGALSSSAFVLPVLKQKQWENRPEGIAALSVLLLQDVAVAPLLVILPLIAGSGPQTGAELGVLTAKATLGFGAVLAAGSVALRYIFDVVAAARSTETFVAAALLVAIGMGQAADYLGLSASTGAFAAGVLLAGNRYRAQIQADVRPFEGILLGIFFLTAGASLDLSIVVAQLPTLLAGIIVFILVKAAVLFAAGPALGLTRAQSARVAITLSGGGEFSFVLFKLAQDLGVLPNDLANLLTASVVISMSLTPLLGEVADQAGNYLETFENSVSDGGTSGLLSRGGSLNAADAAVLFDAIDVDGSGSIELDELRDALVERGLRYAFIGELFTAFDTDGDGTISREEWKAGLAKGLLASALAIEYTAEAAEEGGGKPIVGGGTDGKDDYAQPDIADDAIVICGYTEFGRQIYGVLESAGLTANGGVLAVDLNPSRVAAGILNGATVVYGDGASMNMLKAAGVKHPRAVVVAYRSESRRRAAVAMLREALPDGTPIYARVASGQALGQRELMEAGATEVVSERTEAALRFGNLLGALKDGTNGESDGMEKEGHKKMDTEWLRRQLAKMEPGSSPMSEKVPGFSDEGLDTIAEELGCSRSELVELYGMFSTIPDFNMDSEVDVSELRDILLRTTRSGPIDDAALDKWMERADKDGGGTLTFVEFARAYYSSP
uniref:Calmodulin n=1 Tax=Pseudictyota dubia TaxID=2749911 RepID=A0A7R9ZDG1_9STRA